MKSGTYYAAHADRLKARARERYYANRDVKLAYAKVYRADNAERIRAYKADYRIASAEKVRDGLARWYQENAAHVSVARKAWKLANPDRVYDSNARRRARLKGVDAERVPVARLMAEWDGRCAICHETVEAGGHHFDHIIPLSRGGGHVASNIQITHALCNLRKGARAA